MYTKYSVKVDHYAERHYIKNFVKKYKGAWEVTWQAVCEEFKRFDSLLETSIAEIIVEKGNVKISKTEFRIAGSNQSRKSSGNRCIVVVHEDINLIKVLLVYHKNDLGGGNETAKWKQIIKENYPEYHKLL